jgi:hypothetical protein
MMPYYITGEHFWQFRNSWKFPKRKIFNLFGYKNNYLIFFFPLLFSLDGAEIKRIDPNWMAAGLVNVTSHTTSRHLYIIKWKKQEGAKCAHAFPFIFFFLFAPLLSPYCVFRVSFLLVVVSDPFQDGATPLTHPIQFSPRHTELAHTTRRYILYPTV